MSTTNRLCRKPTWIVAGSAEDHAHRLRVRGAVLRLNHSELLVDLGELSLDRLLHVGEGVWPGLGVKEFISQKYRYRSQKDDRFLTFTDYNVDLGRSWTWRNLRYQRKVVFFAEYYYLNQLGNKAQD
jgi:hypothetical protein